MSKILLLRVFLNERLTAAAEEIFGAVEETIAEYQDEVSRAKGENERLRRLLEAVPEIRADPQPVTVIVKVEEEVPHEKQHCEQEWSLSVGQEDPEPPLIKEEEENLRISQEEEPLQGLHADTIEFTFTPACVQSDHNDQDPTQSSDLYQTQREENIGHSLPSTSSEQITLELDGEDYNMSEPSSQSHAPCCCKVCEKTFNSMASLLKHVQVHSKDKEHLCGVCGKHFESTESKINHMLTHIGAKSCHICGKYFARNFHMEVHMRTHTGEKPFSCNICGKVFNRSENLSTHLRIHTREKPHRCSDCGKCFVTRTDMKVHMRIHTGEKPHRCDDCGRGFTQRSSLEAHVRTHTGEKPYRCHICGKGFTQNGNRNTHMRTHMRATVI